MNYNQRNAFERDGDLRFEPETHTYTHVGRIEPLTSVTSFVGSFFDPYDPYFWINRDATFTDVQKEMMRREQDRKGYVARNLGSFLHTQIERSFLGDNVDCSLWLPPEEGGAEREYFIQKEMEYFDHFVRDHRLDPYRTEWMIYDDKHWLAGTLDLLVEEMDGTFTMYDWKRSRRMGREIEGIFQPNTSNYRQKGHGVLSHLDDTPFIQAALQQNLYAEILKDNYGIEVTDMYLVILSPTFSRYHKIKVPNYQSEIKMMLDLY